MEQKIIWRGFEPSQLDVNYLNKKITRLKEILKAVSGKKEVWIEVSRLVHHRKGPFFNITLDISLKRKALRALGIGYDFQTALNEALKETLIELKKYKEKIQDVKRRKSRQVKENLRHQI